MRIKIQRLHADARIPRYASLGAACFDFHSVAEHRVVRPSSPQTIPTGIAVEIPEGYVMLIFSRSGHGFNYGTRLANCVGIIDSDYRGEIKVKLTSDEMGCPLTISKGDRIAQGMVVELDRIEFVLVDTLSETERGEGGYGSTGK